MSKISKADLIQTVSEKCFLSKTEAINIIDTLFDEISKNLIKGTEVSITNFASFVPITKSSRIGTDPSSHQKITLKEKKTVSFRLSKTLKADLNK